MRGDLPLNQRNNLKLLATIMCYLVRGVSDGSNLKMVQNIIFRIFYEKKYFKIFKCGIFNFFKNFPWEWQSSMFNDTKMNSIYNNSEVKSTIERCQVCE